MEKIVVSEPNFNSHLEKGTIEMNLFYYNELEEYISRLQAERDELKQENEKLKARIDNATKHVKSLSCKGRDCQIYWDIMIVI